jgi:hypothetical protein
MDIITKARLQRQNIIAATVSLDDETISKTPELLAKMNYNGELIKSGTRINWQGIVKRAAVDLWDNEMNNPDNAVNLWEDIAYREGYRIIPDIITVGTAFAKGERGWWRDELYESLIDANVYTPDQYAAGWEKIAEDV